LNEAERKLIMQRISDFVKRRPNIIFWIGDMIYFREPEDLIAFFIQKKFRVWKCPAWRFFCSESKESTAQLRFFYEIIVKWRGGDLKLVTGNATNYSGHGGFDKQVMEFFIQEILKLPMEDRPLNYLLEELVGKIREEIDQEMERACTDLLRGTKG